MATAQLGRWTGMLAAIGGGGWLLLGDRSLASNASAAAIIPFEALTLLLLGGLVGLHARQAARAGWAAWTVGFASANGLSLVLVGQIGAPWGLPNDRGGSVQIQLFTLTAVVLALGSLVYGLSALRAGGRFSLAALALVLGSPAPLLAFDSERGAIAATLWLLFGTGWVALGILLWRDSSAPFRLRVAQPCLCPVR